MLCFLAFYNNKKWGALRESKQRSVQCANIQKSYKGIINAGGPNDWSLMVVVMWRWPELEISSSCAGQNAYLNSRASLEESQLGQHSREGRVLCSPWLSGQGCSSTRLILKEESSGWGNGVPGEGGGEWGQTTELG